MTDDWIKEAFAKAQKMQSEVASIGEELCEFLAEETKAILDSWRAVADEKGSDRVGESMVYTN